MQYNEILTDELKEYCKNIGVDIIGFADPKYFESYSNENQPESFLQNSKSVIIIGMYLYDIILDAWSIDNNKNKNLHFADSILKEFCYKIKNFLRKKGFSAKIIPYKPGIYLKDAGALAGIGSIGKNNLLITKDFGAQIRLRALATTAPLIIGTPIYDKIYCNNCDICIESCPAQALTDGKYNKEACHSYCLSNFKNLSKDTVLWCNICIESCPIGDKKEKN